MKTRTGFVSNSSSSSFIVLVDKDLFNKKSVCPCCGKQKKFYFNSKCFLNHDYGCGDNRFSTVGFKAYIEELEEEKENVELCSYDYLPKNERKQAKEKEKTQIDGNIKKIKELEKEHQDKVLFRIGISYHDDDSNDFLKNMVMDGKVIVVDKD